jgi:hypothetical protein
MHRDREREAANLLQIIAANLENLGALLSECSGHWEWPLARTATSYLERAVSPRSA